MLIRKYDSKTVANGNIETIVTLDGISSKTRKVKRVDFEMADKLKALIWLDQVKVAEVNTAHCVECYGTATVYKAGLDLDIDLKAGQTLKVQLSNGTGSSVTDAECVITYDE